MVGIGLAQNQVFNTVIGYVAIDMVNFFCFAEVAANTFLHYTPMLINVLSLYFVGVPRVIAHNEFVSVIVNNPSFPIMMGCLLGSFISSWHYALFNMAFRHRGFISFASRTAPPALNAAAAFGDRKIAYANHFVFRAAFTLAKNIICKRSVLSSFLMSRNNGEFACFKPRRVFSGFPCLVTHKAPTFFFGGI